MKHITHKLLLLCITALLCSNVAAQSNRPFSIKGVVRDSEGEAIIGANILVKASSEGTMTDIDGNFSLLIVPGKSVLVVSYMGYKKQEVPVKKGDATLLIVLEEDAQQLDNVVVIGYGTQKKSSLTSSVETINSKELLQLPTSNLDQALAGQVSGLQVHSSTGDPSTAKEAEIRIRGIGGTPLLVIDGVPRFGNNSSDAELRLSDLNPDDIESISILKDAAAAAVYGSRAANGVILVQTKRGSRNATKLTYRGQMNLQQATFLPEFVDSYDYASLYNRAVENTPETQNVPYTAEQLLEIKNNTNPNVYGNENLIDYLDTYGYTTTHSISASGGGEIVNYYVSGGYTSSKGLYSGVGRDRYNYAVRLDAELYTGLTFLIDMSGTMSDYKNTSYGTIDAAYSYSPIQTLTFTSGQLASLSGSNPLIAVNGLGGYTNNSMNMITITANLKYKFSGKLKGLSLYGRATIDKNNSTIKTFSPPVSLYTYDPETGAFTEDSKTVYPNAKITLSETNRFVDNKLLEVGLNYSATFNEVHEVTGLLVGNYQDYNNRYLTGKNNNMSGIYPEVVGVATDSSLSGSEYFSQRASAIGRLTYGYDRRYFLEGSFRLDGSTKFHPKNRWGLFFTGSGSWILSNENFFKEWDQKIISNLKLRASSGILGLDSGVSDFSYQNNYIYSTQEGYEIDGNYKPGIVLDFSSFPNPSLLWGKSMDYNLAMDMGFWRNRFGVTVEYFERFQTNMITSAPSYLFPPSTGTSSVVPSINFGKIKSWGWDVALTHRNSIGKLRYNVALNMSRADDVVIDFGDESSVAENRVRVGKSSSLWYLYESDGLFQSQEEIDNYPLKQGSDGTNDAIAPGDIKYVDQNGDGLLTDLDKVGIKNGSYPSMSYSIKLGANYKGFFVNAMIQGVNDYTQLITELYTLEKSSLQRFQQYHMEDTWTPTNTDAAFPRIKFATSNDNNRKASDYWVRCCDYIRLKSLSFGYSFGASVLKKMHLSGLSIALQGGNLYTWSTLDGMDPESLRGYPIQKTYGISLNIER